MNVPHITGTLRRYWGVLAVLLLVIPTLYPLWIVTALPYSHDGIEHVFRTFELDVALRAGIWYPRIFPDMGFGYGLPVLNFYSPLSYYIIELFHLMGTGYILAFKLTVTLAMLGAAISSYRLGKTLGGLRMGVLTALAYTYGPFHLHVAHVRGALPELLGMALVPALMLSLYRMADDTDMRHVLWSGLCIALLILTHNLSAFLLFPFATVYALLLVIWSPRTGRGRLLGRLTLAPVFGAGLTAFFWLPALTEIGSIKASDFEQALRFYLESLFRASDLVRLEPVHTYFVSFDQPSFGLALTVCTLLTVAFVVMRWRNLTHKSRGQFVFWTLAWLTAMFATTMYAAPLWQCVSVASFLQFSFRWMGPATLFAAVVVGYALHSHTLSPKMLRRPAVAAIMVVAVAWVVVSPLPRLRHAPVTFPVSGDVVRETDISLSGLARKDLEWLAFVRTHQWSWVNEYIPVTSSLVHLDRLFDLFLDQEPAPINPRVQPVQAKVTLVRATPFAVTLRAASQNAWTLQLHAFWFPGWRARLDGTATLAHPTSELGLVSVHVPAGKHEISVGFHGTAVRRAGMLITVLALVVWLAMTWRRHRLLMMVVIAVGLAFAVLVMWQSYGAPITIGMTPIQADFNGEVALIGYRVGPARPGDALEVTLSWLAQRTMSRSYKVFVHIVDDTGHLWAQHDSPPLNYGSSTMHWHPGELIVDPHRVPLPPNLPPGRYQVRVGMYDEQTIMRLPVVDAAGQPVDNQVLLSLVQVKDG